MATPINPADKPPATASQDRLIPVDQKQGSLLGRKASRNFKKRREVSIQSKCAPATKSAPDLSSKKVTKSISQKRSRQTDFTTSAPAKRLKLTPKQDSLIQRVGGDVVGTIMGFLDARSAAAFMLTSKTAAEIATVSPAPEFAVRRVKKNAESYFQLPEELKTLESVVKAYVSHTPSNFAKIPKIAQVKPENMRNAIRSYLQAFDAQTLSAVEFETPISNQHVLDFKKRYFDVMKSTLGITQNAQLDPIFDREAHLVFAQALLRMATIKTYPVTILFITRPATCETSIDVVTSILELIPREYLNDRDFLYTLVEAAPEALFVLVDNPYPNGGMPVTISANDAELHGRFLTPENHQFVVSLLQDRDFSQQVVKITPTVLPLFNKKFSKDQVILLTAAITLNPALLPKGEIDSDLLNNRDFILQLIDINPQYYHMASPVLQKERAVAMLACATGSISVPDQFKNDKNFVLGATEVAKDRGNTIALLAQASSQLRSDSSFVEQMADINPGNLVYALDPACLSPGYFLRLCQYVSSSSAANIRDLDDVIDSLFQGRTQEQMWQLVIPIINVLIQPAELEKYSTDVLRRIAYLQTYINRPGTVQSPTWDGLPNLNHPIIEETFRMLQQQANDIRSVLEELD